MVQFLVVGAACFGAVVGWLACRVNQDTPKVDVKWLASMMGVIAGGAVTALFDSKSAMFGTYCIGLAMGFFFRPIALWLEPFFKDEQRIELAQTRPEGTDPAVQEPKP